MTRFDPQAARAFAVETVQRLRDAGFEALWAGGCVRDQLLGVQPKDYDVATNAEPDEVRAVFGRRRTLAIGASFGVITVIGTKASGNIEVATFRRDAAYSDGRHPDSVTFSTAEEDARRRDFTINGLFYDPLAEEVIDYVGGQMDIERKVVRAIGDPNGRFNEDKLRILRAVRFATVLGFEIDSRTMKAIRRHAHELVIVSAERIAIELRKMLSHANRRRAVELLAESELLPVIFPECEDVDLSNGLTTLEALDEPSFPIALALLLRRFGTDETSPGELAGEIGARLRLTNEETKTARWLVTHEAQLAEAPARSWPEIQRLLIQPEAQQAPAYLRALSAVDPALTAAIEFCSAKLALPAEQLNPPPLITGKELKRLGLKSGPQFKQILDAVRDLQLTGELQSADDAIDKARELAGG